MERVIELINKRANNREIVLYGYSNMAEALYEMLRAYGCTVSFFVDLKFSRLHSLLADIKDPSILNSGKHFPLIVPCGEKVISSIKADCKKVGYSDNDWLIWYRDIDFDINYKNIILGKHFQLSKSLIEYDSNNYIKSVGRFSSINHSLRYGFDHKFEVSTSALINSFKSNIVEEKLTIGNDVWIGSNVFVNCSKVKYIGNGAVIGASTVVLDDVPDYTVVVGNPGRIIKYRFNEEQIELLKKAKWWEWEDSKIFENIECFEDYNLFFNKFC